MTFSLRGVGAFVFLAMLGLYGCRGNDGDIVVDAGIPSDGRTADRPRVDTLDDAGVDALDDAGLQELCVGLKHSWNDTVASLSRSCMVDDDCVVVGGSRDCECNPFLGDSCQGVSVNAAAYWDSGAGAMHQAYFDSCSAFGPAVCDCIEGLPRCDEGTCSQSPRCCMCWQLDGGSDAEDDGGGGAGGEDAAPDSLPDV